jgi:hypothetical protein
VEPESGWIVIDLPDHDADRWEHVVTVSAGQPVLLNALPDTARPGWTRVLIVTVSRFPWSRATTPKRF